MTFTIAAGRIHGNAIRKATLKSRRNDLIV